MSQKQSGLKAPSRLARASGLPQTRPAPGAKAQGALEKSARAAGLSAPRAEDYAHHVMKQLPGPSPDDVQQPAFVDDFKIGDRVWVSGTKPGRIAYIGETQFAAGEWAGVVLDEPVGKNDGSVSGVKYFQCENKRGVFSRVTKLFRGPLAPGEAAMNTSMISTLDTSVIPQTPAKPAVTSHNGAIDRGDVTSISAIAPTGASTNMVTSTPAHPSALARKTLLTSSQTNLAATNLPPPTTAHTETVRHNFKVGDRVIVSGSKQGILRYLGVTDFAPGDWAGVELDEPQGKNDGAVAGKRYFNCRPLYGIFSKTNKVAKVAAAPLPASTPLRRPSAGKYGLSSLQRDRFGSQDSVSSIGSSVSTSSRSRAKAGSRPKTLSLPAQNTSLQKALKEKVEHIDQLLQERDLERSELARSSALAENAESALANFKAENDRLCAEKDEALTQLQQMLDKMQAVETNNKDLKLRLDEEKRKVEDLQFSVEEATILQDEQEALSTEGAEAVGKLKTLEDNWKKETERATALETKLSNAKAQYQDYKAKAKDAEDTSVVYLDQIEELTHKLTMSETQIRKLSEAKEASGAKSSEFEFTVVEKDEKIAELEASQHEIQNQVKLLTNKLKETVEELTQSIEMREKQQDTIDEMMGKVASSDTAASNLSADVNQLKSQLAELQRQLDSSHERSQQLENDKAKLENQITELMDNSGDSSKQLSLLNDEMLDKERRLQECKTALCDSTREVGKLRQELEEQQSENERQTEIVAAKHQEDLASAQTNQLEKQSELEKLQSKLEQLKIAHEEDKTQLLKQKDIELTELRKVVESKEEQLQRAQQDKVHSQAQVEGSSTEKEQLKFEKERLEKQVKKLESDKESLALEKDEAVTDRDLLAVENKDLQEKHESTVEQISQLKTEKEQIVTEKNQLLTERDELKSASERLGKEKETLQQAQGSTSSSLHDKDVQIQELTDQVEILHTEADCDKEAYEKQLATLKDQAQQVEKQSGESQELHGRLQLLETEREALKLQVNKLKVKEEERLTMEKQQESMNQQINELRSSSTTMKEEFSVEKKSLQNSIDTLKHQVDEKCTQLDQLKTQMASLEGENLAINSYKSTIQGLEIDKQNLQRQVKDMDKAIKEMTSVNSAALDPNDAAVAKLQSERETAAGQVQFLNSVIVDLQQKNGDLSLRLAAMENGGLLNGANDSSFEINDKVRKAAPRLFCDICDVFDVHDTEDCPTQAMDPDHAETQHHGERGQHRAFCDTCEIFGHATEDCDDEQTF